MKAFLSSWLVKKGKNRPDSFIWWPMKYIVQEYSARLCFSSCYKKENTIRSRFISTHSHGNDPCLLKKNSIKIVSFFPACEACYVCLPGLRPGGEPPLLHCPRNFQVPRCSKNLFHHDLLDILHGSSASCAPKERFFFAKKQRRDVVGFYVGVFCGPQKKWRIKRLLVKSRRWLDGSGGL